MFSNILSNVKTSYKQANKHSLKTNVNLTAKLSKANLKHIHLKNSLKIKLFKFN